MNLNQETSFSPFNITTVLFVQGKKKFTLMYSNFFKDIFIVISVESTEAEMHKRKKNCVNRWFPEIIVNSNHIN